MSKNKYLIAIRRTFHCYVLKQIMLVLVLIAIITSCSGITNEASQIEFEKNETPKIAVMNPEDTSY